MDWKDIITHKISDTQFNPLVTGKSLKVGDLVYSTDGTHKLEVKDIIEETSWSRKITFIDLTDNKEIVLTVGNNSLWEEVVDGDFEVAIEGDWDYFTEEYKKLHESKSPVNVYKASYSEEGIYQSILIAADSYDSAAEKFSEEFEGIELIGLSPVTSEIELDGLEQRGMPIIEHFNAVYGEADDNYTATADAWYDTVSIEYSDLRSEYIISKADAIEYLVDFKADDIAEDATGELADKFDSLQDKEYYDFAREEISKNLDTYVDKYAKDLADYYREEAVEQEIEYINSEEYKALMTPYDIFDESIINTSKEKLTESAVDLDEIAIFKKELELDNSLNDVEKSIAEIANDDLRELLVNEFKVAKEETGNLQSIKNKLVDVIAIYIKELDDYLFDESFNKDLTEANYIGHTEVPYTSYEEARKHLKDINMKDFEADLINTLKDNKVYFSDLWFNPDANSISVRVEDGDWKHEHARLDYFVDEFFADKGLIVSVMQDIDEDDSDDDVYSATHTYSVGDIIFKQELKEAAEDGLTMGEYWLDRANGYVAHRIRDAILNKANSKAYGVDLDDIKVNDRGVIMMDVILYNNGKKVAERTFKHIPDDEYIDEIERDAHLDYSINSFVGDFVRDFLRRR